MCLGVMFLSLFSPASLNSWWLKPGGSLWFHVEAFLLSWQLTPPVTQPQLQTGTLSRMTCRNLNKTLLLILYKVCQSNWGDITTAAVHAKSRDCRDPEISLIWFVVCLPALVDPCQITGLNKVALVGDKLIWSDKAESYHAPCLLSSARSGRCGLCLCSVAVKQRCIFKQALQCKTGTRRSHSVCVCLA